jgi:predicted Zn-dependent protease
MKTRTPWAVIFCIPIVITSSCLLDTTGRVCSWFISDTEESSMGDTLKLAILKDTQHYPPYTRNQAVIRYVDSVGQAIVDAQTMRPENSNFKYDFTVISLDTVVNAFAIPGGHVFVYSGLIKACSTEAELAGVMAHEVAHITNRHGVQAMCNAGLVGFVSKVILGDSSMIGQILDGMLMLKFSRDNEFEADSCSATFLNRAKWNPSGMKNFLVTLKNLYGDTPRYFEPFTTHPSTTDRITRAIREIGRLPDTFKNDSCLYRQRFLQVKGQL